MNSVLNNVLVPNFPELTETRAEEQVCESKIFK